MFCYKICLITIMVFGFLNIFLGATISAFVVTDTPVRLLTRDFYNISNEDLNNDKSDVEVMLYYECLCPDCINFDKHQFRSAVQKLSQYVDFYTYPYGNAQTIVENGEVMFKCQHGPEECYGNMLHACAIKYLDNVTEAIMFNSCMMGGNDDGSNDDAAERCAKSMALDANPIETCAKGEMGIKLLQYCGEESKRANFSYVPYILINGQVNDGNNLMKDICAAFAVPPPPCAESSLD